MRFPQPRHFSHESSGKRRRGKEQQQQQQQPEQHCRPRKPLSSSSLLIPERKEGEIPGVFFSLSARRGGRSETPAEKMAVIAKTTFRVVSSIILLAMAVIVPAAQAQVQAPAAPPTSDGTTVDQGIACLLMLVALVLTYLIHSLDAASPYKLF